MQVFFFVLNLFGSSHLYLMLCSVIMDLFSLVKKCFVIVGQELTGCLNAPVVFAHNDLLSGNLMLNDDESMVFPHRCLLTFGEPLTVPFVQLFLFSIFIRTNLLLVSKKMYEPDIYFCHQIL